MPQCKNIIEKTFETSVSACPVCGRKINSQIKMLETVKQVFLCFGFIALLLVPRVKGPDSSGTYVMRGKTTAIIPFTSLAILNVLNVIAVVIFFELHSYFRRKLELKPR